MGVLGASLNAPPLKGITWQSEMKERCVLGLLSAVRLLIRWMLDLDSSIDEMDSRLGFASFVNRGRTFVSTSRDEKSAS
jgi:membrane magnesium transporter 1